jgi:hypothetical protein
VKRTGLIFTTITLFAVSLYAAYMQGISYAGVSGLTAAHLAAPANYTLSPFWDAFMNLFSLVLNGLTGFFGGSLVAGIIVLALLVELVTLYSSVSLQLMQKQIHLFHKKLVDRFTRGELSVSSTKHELDVLYSVNERMHQRGALLISSQVLVFLLVFAGLYFTARVANVLPGAFSAFNFALLSRPADLSLPVLASLAYLAHSLVRIYLKQLEDYIDPKQVNTAFGFSLIFAGLVFYFASVFAVLLTVFFMTQLTFATMRYIIVEEKSAQWSKTARKELIHMLRTSSLHKNKLEHWSRKFNHLPIVRYLNFHLLEEAASMSLALVIVLSGMILM